MTFWDGFVSRGKERGLLPPHPKPTAYYLHFRANRRGLMWGYQRHRKGVRVTLHFYLPGDREGSFALFRKVRAHQAEIQAALGTLEWQENRSGAHVALEIPVTAESWESGDTALFDAMLDGMSRFQRALQPYVSALP